MCNKIIKQDYKMSLCFKFEKLDGCILIKNVDSL